ncbi:hypothetical protein BC937DRAFT_90451 [Endogone sp. FLAS-F59071]|nr:hypothetical protein BC937DRAFT_90451 [Endogone sp. FLAS-F59071]|eukprot:RUS22086.1 hypothetical protein BC937DRAFT_90451 [Endogone sp. FLAS-F59071]
MRTFSRLSFFALALIQFVRPAHSTITLAAADGTVLTTFDNADIGSQTYSITGPVALASFFPTNVSNCTMQPVPPGTAVLLVPFDDGLLHDYPPAEYGQEPLNGCRFYDQIVANAGWFVSNSNSTHPLIAIFQSARTGDALGLVEMGVNNEDLLSKSSVKLTLAHTQDFQVMMDLVNKTAVVYVTAEQGKFIVLLQSTTLLVYRIIVTTTYCIIMIFSIISAYNFLHHSGWVPQNIKMWSFAGVAICCFSHIWDLLVQPKTIYFTNNQYLGNEANVTFVFAGELMVAYVFIFLTRSWIVTSHRLHKSLNRPNRAMDVLHTVANIFTLASALIYFLDFIAGRISHVNRATIEYPLVLFGFSAWTMIQVALFILFGILMVRPITRSMEGLPANVVSVRKSTVMKITLITIGIPAAVTVWLINYLLYQTIPSSVASYWLTQIFQDAALFFIAITLIISLRQSGFSMSQSGSAGGGEGDTISSRSKVSQWWPWGGAHHGPTTSQVSRPTNFRFGGGEDFVELRDQPTVEANSLRGSVQK